MGLVYVTPVITNYHWKKLRNNHPDYFTVSHERMDRIVSEEGYKSQITRYKQYFDMIKKYKKRGKLLDVGCGCGVSLRVFRELGYEAAGIEALPESWGDLTSFKKRHNIEIYEGFFDEELPSAISSDKYDIITFWESLEHIVSPEIALHQAFNLLNHGGIVVITVPNWDNFENRLLREYSSFLRGEGHINMFNHHTLKTLLNICGFEILKIETMDVSDINNIINYLSLELDRTNSYTNYGKYQKETKYRVQRYFCPEIDTILKTKFFKLLLYGYESIDLKGPLLFVIAKKCQNHD